MNPWFLLAIAIAAKLGATAALKFSDGFTKPGPAAAFIKDPDGYWIEIVQPDLLKPLGRA